MFYHFANVILLIRDADMTTLKNLNNYLNWLTFSGRQIFAIRFLMQGRCCVLMCHSLKPKKAPQAEPFSVYVA
jgi:hypothetical protein